MKYFIELKSKDQIKLGDDLVIVGKSPSDSQVISVKDILDVDGKEEIILDQELNRYFITDMYLKGQSWAEDVFIIKVI